MRCNEKASDHDPAGMATVARQENFNRMTNT